MDLKDLVVDSKSAWVSFPGMPDFEVEVVNLSRKALTKLRKKCTNQKFNRKTRQVEEELDDELFVQEFSRAVVKNWKGLTLDKLSELMLIEVGDNDPETEVPFNQENAELLVKESSDFDTFINEVCFDISRFRE